ncbi:MAG: DHHA1 domain-containing protein [Candidatus Competibacteraceae bacterium]
MINPLRADCRYPDTTVAGCMIAWLLMSRVRNRLIENGQLPADAPKLAKELDYVSLGTVADCVSIGTPINRAVVNVGLSQINTLARPCWQAMQTLLNRNGQPFCAEDLAFQIGPRINARSRMADPYAALHFLLAGDHEDAFRYLEVLDCDNQDRKFIERDMTETAKRRAASLVEQGYSSLVIYLPEGHPGVQGIVASRLVEAFGRPAIVLCDSHEPTQLTGSARGITELHLRDALQGIVDVHPNLLIKFGGHKHAAGLAIERALLGTFQTAFEQAVRAQLGARKLMPVIWTDGELPAESFSLETLTELDRLQPFGREFEVPIFEGHFKVAEVRAVGAEPIHLSLQLRTFDAVFSAIWFRALEAAGAPLPFAPGDTIHCAYQLNGNTFRGRTKLQLIVKHAAKLVA